MSKPEIAWYEPAEPGVTAMRRQHRRHDDLWVRLSDYEALAEELDRQSVITGDYIARAQRMGDENAELRAALQSERDRYFREVYGLNNEGDPIGGDPAGGYVNQIAMLREALAQTDALASEAARRNEDMGRRVHELEDELARIIGVRDGAALVIEQHLLDLKLDAERYRAMRDIVVNESAMNPDQYDAEADRLIGYAATQSQQAKP